MNLSVGIVGLPNVGKSTLFNALLKKQVAYAANYPFATIEPNVGVVEVPDARLIRLAEIVKTNKIQHAIVEFYDIAGLVTGASTGEGLGNKFLSHIREVSVIVHVVRLFEDSSITHVSNKIEPKDDMEIIESELILADLSTLEKHIKPNKKLEKEEILFYDTVELLRVQLNKGIPARNVKMTDDQNNVIKKLNLLSSKPVLYVFNVSEKQLSNKDDIENKIKETLNNDSRQDNWLYLCAKLESDMIDFSDSERHEYLEQFGLHETGLNRLIQKAYSTLGLISFLTAGEIEARAWTITKGTLAPVAAGVIHTDFEKHFIKAEIVKYDDFVDCGGWTQSRALGKVTLAGKDYIMQDGDVVDFKIGV